MASKTPLMGLTYPGPSDSADLSYWLQQLAQNVEAPFVTKTFTPAVNAPNTDPVLGTGSTASGWYVQIGKTVIGAADITFGTTGVNPGSGAYYLKLPVALPTPLFAGTIGSLWVYDASALMNYVGVLAPANALQALGRIHGVSGSVTNAAPMTFAASDAVRYEFRYQAA